MAERRVFAGPAVRKVRRDAGMTQAAMAEALDISPSYLNLIEHGQRPLSATVIVKLAERFGFDAATLGGDAVPGGAAGLRRRLSDPRLADLGIGAQEVEEWLQAAPTTAAAFARLFDAAPKLARLYRKKRPKLPRCAARSRNGAITSPISMRGRRSWPTNCGWRGATFMARFPSDCGRGTSSASGFCPAT